MRACEFITEHKLVWKRNAQNGKISLKWRCTSGNREGRVVPKLGDCDAALDIAQAQRMKKTRERNKIRQARRARRTKKLNPSSKLVQKLNKYTK